MLHYPHSRCLAVVPAYNEQGSIVGVIQALRGRAGTEQRLPASREGAEASLAGWGR